jgi:hypothetical protein
MLKLFFTLLAMSFEVFASTNGCPNGWVQSADKTTCVQTIINNTTANSTNDTSRPICINGYFYNSSLNQCQKTTPYNSQTANKTYTFISNLYYGADPHENDMCLNVSGIQYAVPANAYASGGNCYCNSGYVYNGLTDGSAGCNAASPASYNGCVHDSNYSFKCNNTSTSKCNNQSSITFYQYGYICGLSLPNQVKAGFGGKQPITFLLGGNFDNNYESSEYGPDPGNCLGYYTNIKGSCDSTNSICSYDISYKSHSGDSILLTDKICVQLK